MTEFNATSPQTLIESTEIVFDNNTSNVSSNIISNGWKFGIFKLNIIPNIPITQNHKHLFFTIDGSGSMCDLCMDGRTKMQHIHFTLENMIKIFYEKLDTDISIHVQSFDENIYEHIVGIQNIKTEMLDTLIHKVKKISPGGSTNIEIALQSASQQISKYKLENPEHDVVHILLTDGEITEGSKEKETLKNLVPTNCVNIFIGYGQEHDSKLLDFLGNGKTDEYRFIDILEKAGLVYGEIIHSILYKAYDEVTIVAENGELYDYNTNNWTTELYVGNLLSEQKKVYHIRTQTNSQTNLITLKVFTKGNLITTETDKLDTANLAVYIYRQKTQELLYEAQHSNYINIYQYNNYNDNDNDNDNDNYNDNNENTDDLFTLLTPYKPRRSRRHSTENPLKTTLKNIRNEMIAYMNTHSLEANEISLMKMLCDDIHICVKTFGTSVGNMFTCSRRTSQGRQQSYACQNLPTNTNYLATNEDTNGLLSQDMLSPYSSNGVVDIMREITGDYTLHTQHI